MSSNLVAYLATHPWILAAVAIWTLPWKGIALWKAARSRSVFWFVILLLVNTLGILDIIYIFYFSRKNISLPEIELEGAQSLEKKVMDIKRDNN